MGTYREVCLLHVIKQHTGVVVNVHGLREASILGPHTEKRQISGLC